MSSLYMNLRAMLSCSDFLFPISSDICLQAEARLDVVVELCFDSQRKAHSLASFVLFVMGLPKSICLSKLALSVITTS